MAEDLKLSSVSSSAKATILTQNDGVPGCKFEGEPAKYTVEQLKRWLKCRGIKQTGKREDLLARVNDCLKSGNSHILDSCIDNGKWLEAKILRERNAESLTSSTNTVNDVPVTVPQTGWKAFPSQDLPSLFNYGHVYHYALESLPTLPRKKNYNEEDEDEEFTSGIGHMTDKPFSNGRKYVDSGFVHDLTDTKADDYYYVKAHVWPSMNTDFPHNVLVVLSVKSGAVVHQLHVIPELGRCSHVVAVLLSLVGHVRKHGTITTPCTSQECTWNKGKKRKKTPQRLSAAKYPSNVKKRKIEVIDFDPRPAKYRKVSSSHINNFVRNLQAISADQKKTAMWETQLTITYDDYNLEDTSVLEQQVSNLMANLTPDCLSQMEGTTPQNKSEKWYSERWCRITASTYSDAYRAGKKVQEGSNNASALSNKYIASNIWNTNGDKPQSYWMKYGLESEADAISKYETQTKQHVTPSGLWVNPKFPFLACSPDGLLGQDGLVEIKSLKLFKEHSIDAVCNDRKTLISKDVINRQCFSIKDNKSTLKQSHSYYYQIQMQLLVTERTFCDFVLYAKNGPVSIERIYGDDNFITEMLSVLTLFWKRVVAPEIFEMRVPRDLSPFVLPSDFFNELTLPAFDILSPFVTNVFKPQSTSSTDQTPSTTKPTIAPPIPSAGTNASVPLVTHSRDLPSDVTHPTVYLTTLHTGIPAAAAGSTLPSTAPESQVPPATVSPTYPPGTPNSDLPKGATSALQHSKDELDIANFLTTCTSASRIPAFSGILPTGLAVIPWGGTTRHGIVLANTCPVDNWLMIFQALVKSGRIDLDDLAGAGNVIKTALSLIDRRLIWRCKTCMSAYRANSKEGSHRSLWK